MIRVFRVRPGESFGHVPERAPDLVAAQPEGVHRLLPAELGPPEVAAIERALSEVGSASEVDIVVAAGTGLFRLFGRETAAPREASVAPAAPVSSVAWATREPGSVVLVLDGDPAVARLGEALRFLGYDARRGSARDFGALEGSLAENAPILVILGPKLARALDLELVALCRSHGCAVVAIGSDESVRAHVDAFLPLPLMTARLASALDAAIRVAREEPRPTSTS